MTFQYPSPSVINCLGQREGRAAACWHHNSTVPSGVSRQANALFCTFLLFHCLIRSTVLIRQVEVYPFQYCEMNPVIQSGYDLPLRIPSWLMAGASKETMHAAEQKHRTSPNGANGGRIIRTRSIPRDWCSSTKHGPKPTWF